MQEDKLVYTVVEVSEILGLSLKSTYKLIAQEGFPLIRAGKRLLIPKTGLVHWLEKSANVSS